MSALPRAESSDPMPPKLLVRSFPYCGGYGAEAIGFEDDTDGYSLHGQRKAHWKVTRTHTTRV